MKNIQKNRQISKLAKVFTFSYNNNNDVHVVLSSFQITNVLFIVFTWSTFICLYLFIVDLSLSPSQHELCFVLFYWLVKVDTYLALGWKCVIRMYNILFASLIKWDTKVIACLQNYKKCRFLFITPMFIFFYFHFTVHVCTGFKKHKHIKTLSSSTTIIFTRFLCV